jgi:hypothetical protein
LASASDRSERHLSHFVVTQLPLLLPEPSPCRICPPHTFSRQRGRGVMLSGQEGTHDSGQRDELLSLALLLGFHMSPRAAPAEQPRELIDALPDGKCSDHCQLHSCHRLKVEGSSFARDLIKDFIRSTLRLTCSPERWRKRRVDQIMLCARAASSADSCPLTSIAAIRSAMKASSASKRA